MEMDEALRVVGGWRRWSLGIFALLGTSTFMGITLQTLAIVFIGWEPPYKCHVTQNSTRHASPELLFAPPEMEGNITAHARQCGVQWMRNGEEINVTSCDGGWDYQTEGYQTIVNEWDLVCSNNYLVAFSQAIVETSGLVGALLLSLGVDYFGRKVCHITAHMAICVFGIGLAFVRSYTAFVVMRSIVGFFSAVPVLSGTTLLLELFDSSKRTLVGIGMEAFWILDYCLLPFLAYWIQSWRTLQLVLSLPSAVWIMYIWILPRSPMWLFSRGKVKDATESLRQMARWNNVGVAPLQLAEDRSKVNGHTGLELHHLFAGRRMTLHTCMNCLLWFTNCAIYYSLVLMSPQLAGNRFLNYTLMGLVEIPAYIVIFFCIDRVGRKLPLTISHVATGVPLIVASILQATSTGSSSIVTALAIVAKLGITASFAVIVLYTPELFPTYLRGTSGGMAKVAGGVGTIIAPFAAYSLQTHYYWLPTVVFGVLTIATGALVLLLPETNRKPLPITKQDVIRLYA